MATLLENQPSEVADEAPASLLRALLEESREPTAVERFAKLHEEGAPPAQAKHYRDLIPTGPPGEGRQYAFEVDLDVCSGCKACVSACHHMNGLEPQETWRSVGQLYGGGEAVGDSLPIIQHVTTACHHCVEPGCLAGCPTNAYEKDPETGIVRHLDDQCFGCQYCTMACPYEVPQYSHSKGIVRKCDMCHGRLAAGEAPACVAACPNQAIRITTVDVKETVARTDRDLFLPDTPPAQLTNPTTVYKTAKGLPTNSSGADAAHAEPQHAHAPLVVMLVLTQMSVGVLTAGAVLRWFGGGMGADVAIVLGALIGQAGLAVAPLHLGRPHLAFRAVLGWRHSWLSREAIAFGLYAAPSMVAAGYAMLPHLMPYLPEFLAQPIQQYVPPVGQPLSELAAISAGVLAIYCSARIYMFTGRTFWLGGRTLGKFFGTAVVLGLAFAAAACGGGLLAAAAFVAVSVKLLYEAGMVATAQDLDTDLPLTQQLQIGPLKQITAIRFACGLVGLLGLAAATLLAPVFTAGLATLALVGGELAERWLYFSTVVPLRMPGGTPTR